MAARDGARVVVAPVPFPLHSAQQVLEAVLRCVTARTRLTVVDHVTSATALVLPLAELISELGSRGVETLVDGAHAPGQLPLAIDRLGAAFYTGNLHKWLCAPKGAGFLWVRRDRQSTIHPVTTSHGANSPRTDRSRFRLEFDWTGTADPSAYLAVPDAIRFGDELLPGGWDALLARNHSLALEGRDMVCAALAIPSPAPDEMVGSMASLPLPGEIAAGAVQGVDLYGDAVHDYLEARGMQVMVTPWPQRPDGGTWRRLLRISAAAYNDAAQYRRLADHLPGALAGASAALAGAS